MSKVHVSKLSSADKGMEALKGDVFTIKNESLVVDALVTFLGIPRDGSATKIRVGFMAYDAVNKILFFANFKYDLPSYLGKKPVKPGMKN